jgi:hypothetical protein
MDAHAPLLRATQRTKVVFLLSLLVGQNEEAGAKRRGGALAPDGGRGGPEVVPGRAEAAGRYCKGSIKKTSSGKFQPQLFIKELNTQRALGSCDTAEEAAEMLAEANEGGCIHGSAEEAGKAWFGAPHLPALCPAYLHTSTHADHADHAAPRVAGVDDGRGA